MPYDTKDWNAYSWSKDFSGQGAFLGVTGDVQTTRTNQKPQLTKAEPQGINPKILLLRLSVSTDGAGGDLMQWKRVGYRQSEDSGQYESVTITGDCAEVTVRVMPIIS
jgi:hypothetical protein